MEGFGKILCSTSIWVVTDGANELQHTVCDFSSQWKEHGSQCPVRILAEYCYVPVYYTVGSVFNFLLIQSPSLHNSWLRLCWECSSFMFFTEILLNAIKDRIKQLFLARVEY